MQKTNSGPGQRVGEQQSGPRTRPQPAGPVLYSDMYRALLDSLPVPSPCVAAPQNITTADNFYRNKAICSLPDVPELRSIPGLDLYPTTSICNAMYGIRSYKVKGLPGGPAQNIEVGSKEAGRASGCCRERMVAW